MCRMGGGSLAGKGAPLKGGQQWAILRPWPWAGVRKADEGELW